MSRKNNDPRNPYVLALAHFSQIAITIIACVAVGIFLGWLLDRYLGTSPWLLLVFTLLGIIAAFKSILEFSKKF